MMLFKGLFLVFTMSTGIEGRFLHKEGCSTKVTFAEQKAFPCSFPDCPNLCPPSTGYCKNCGVTKIRKEMEGLCVPHIMQQMIYNKKKKNARLLHSEAEAAPFQKKLKKSYRSFPIVQDT
ncbi:hypothetical protein PGTUg99_017999 [Puccinia graminis f. sp. tritici]|uniref:Secreted protein n=1 Tax=Puccinia graminis f. sp. tritici TaxID=56615 RepID=A0A5B0M8S3_PUCGR|nr:hypothetical protein PGTUg99_017999 [Puccinia graminis f. sp. tritici]